MRVGLGGIWGGLRPRRPELQGAAFFVFDEEAGVFDYEEAGGAGFFGGGGVGDA